MNLLSNFFLPRFGEFSKKWLLEEYSQKVEAHNVQKAIRLFECAVYPKIGDKKLNKITHQDIVDIVRGGNQDVLAV